MTESTQGKLANHPLAELIREIGEAAASGALRLSRDRAKTVVYFEKGSVVFAASNIRAHRLAEFLKRTGVVDEGSLSGLPPTANDDEILSHLTKNNVIQASSISTLRASQVADILRGTLLWTEGEWQFDPKVRVTGDTRVDVDAGRLLLEAARHLPAAYVSSRFGDTNEQIEPAALNGQTANLLPSEAFVLSRVTSVITIKELVAASGLTEGQTLRAVYALAICGAINCDAWGRSQFNTAQPAQADAKSVRPEARQAETVESFLARLEDSSDYYQVLGVERRASSDEIKNAYHSVARLYHPDRFHQADERLRNQIESAFARVAQAHEVLSNPPSRADYDAQFYEPAASLPNPGASLPNPGASLPNTGASGSAQTSRIATSESRAESSFQKGLAAVQQNQPQHAVRFFAEAASLGPRCARYRAEYGRALISDPATRRIAEIELKAAIELEPKNVSYRVVLAELYKALGLRRRAQGELQRALIDDPKNAAARSLLATLKN